MRHFRSEFRTIFTSSFLAFPTFVKNVLKPFKNFFRCFVVQWLDPQIFGGNIDDKEKILHPIIFFGYVRYISAKSASNWLSKSDTTTLAFLNERFFLFFFVNDNHLDFATIFSLSIFQYYGYLDFSRLDVAYLDRSKLRHLEDFL